MISAARRLARAASSAHLASPQHLRHGIASSMTDRATNYARAVVSGAVVAGLGVSAACQRHLDDLKHGAKRGFRWRSDLGARALEFFPECLRLFEGQYGGQPFAPEDWQAFIVESLHGWVGKDGFRRLPHGVYRSRQGQWQDAI